MKRYILVTAEMFGYGPIITCLNVIKSLKKETQTKDIDLVFLGTSIAKEQAQKSKLFDKIIECKTYDYNSLKKFDNLFINALAVISSENQFGAIYAKKLKVKNVFFIDNLVWMWDKITSGLEEVDGYFISETFDSKDNFRKIGQNIKNPIFVGPLRDINTKSYKTENMLLINFGGAESFMLEKDIVVTFYKKILSEILVNKVLNKFDKIHVCGGSGIINELQGFSNKKVVVKTLSNQEYLNKLHKSTHIIMSSGLGNFIESIGINKNILYIPPVNYSQLLQIDNYKKLNLGLELVNWSDYSFYKQVPNLLDEEEGVNLVIDNVKNYLTSIDKVLTNKVLNFIDTSQEKYFEKRKQYINSFSKNSAKVVVKYIMNLIKG